MAFPEDQVLVRIQFQVGGSANLEIQNTGFWAQVQDAGGVGFDWQDACNAMAEKVRDTWKANVQTALFAGAIVAQNVIVYHYDEIHKNVLHRGEAGFSGASAWAGTGNPMPLQCSVVLSLYGYDPAQYATQRDRKRGRMYLPTPTGSSLDGEGTISEARQDEYLASFGAWWAALQGVITLGLLDFNMQPVIASRAGQFTTDAKWLRVGRVIDTQRRRRNALPERYKTINVP